MFVYLSCKIAIDCTALIISIIYYHAYTKYTGSLQTMDTSNSEHTALVSMVSILKRFHCKSLSIVSVFKQ